MSLAARKIRPTSKARPRVTIHELVKNGNPALWFYVPQVQERIRQFAGRYPTEYDGPHLSSLLEQNFIAPFPEVVAFIALRELRLVGHLLVAIEHHGNTTVANILQYEIDRGAAIPDRQMRGAMRRLTAWASRHGAREIQAQVRNELLERAFRQMYGFERLRVVIRKEL